MSEPRTPGRPRPRARNAGPDSALRGKLRAHDPFELIRWLALSQPDPRKALAELVQNSLDAGARQVRVTRVRERGAPCLRIFDDGEGVIPELGRADALKFIATHIGHSRKRSLSPQERLALMTQGQYGIGLLGFWSLGQQLEMRTAVPGSRPHRLILYRDRPEFLIEPLRGRLALDERWTDVVVAGLHREAQAALLGRRAADYLAAELRGQLLAREVELVVEDRMSRGRAPKRIEVRPRRFLGERLEGIGPVEVPGHPPIRLEVYLSGEPAEGAPPHRLAVYAAGTLAAEGFGELGALGLDRPPWTDARLSGLVDFPGLHVAPGSRRGIVVDAAAGAFAEALRRIEPILCGVLEAVERQRAEELDRSLIRELQRAFRDLQRDRPRYAMLPVAKHGDHGVAAGRETDARAPVAGAPDAPEGEEAPAAPARRAGPSPPRADLLPPGPLDAVRLVPAEVRVAIGGTRRVRAFGLDAIGRPVGAPLELDWRLEGPVGRLDDHEPSAAEVVLIAGESEAEGRLLVTARSSDRTASAEAPVEVLEAIGSRRASEGIPEPELVDQPGAGWRSRMLDGRWQVNAGHRDYRSLVDRPVLKLRYLALLFSKEIVLRNGQDPRLERPLEQMVEVAAFADRKLASRGRRRGAQAEEGGT
jgi:hypothetical protein